MDGIKAFLRRQFTLDNLVGQLLWTGLVVVMLAVGGWLLKAPPLSLAGLLLGGVFITSAAVIARREGWRPGTMRGVRGWKASVTWKPFMGTSLMVSLQPPPDTEQVECLCEVRSRSEVEAFSGDQIRPPGSAGASGKWNTDYYVILKRGAPFPDGRRQVRWWIASGAGLLPVASCEFRIKRGRLV